MLDESPTGFWRVKKQWFGVWRAPNSFFPAALESKVAVFSAVGLSFGSGRFKTSREVQEMGMAQNSRATVAQVLVFPSVYQGVMLVPLF